MSKLKLPLRNPKPNIDEFTQIMSGKGLLRRVPLVEYVVDDAVMKPILEEMIGRKWVDISKETGVLSNKIKFSKEHLEISDLRKYVRKVIDSCSLGGLLAVGSGNSIYSYVIVVNFLTMVGKTLNY